MRGKKRKFLFGILILFLLLIVYVISYKYLIVPYQIKELNDNMVINGIPYKIGDKMDNLDLRVLQEEGWEKGVTEDHSILYNNETYGVIIFRGFPDYSNDYKFTLFRTRHNSFSLFGIKIGDDASEAQNIFKKRGYKEVDDTTYVKGRIKIEFYYGLSGKIEQLGVNLKSSDWFYKGNYK